MSLVSSTAGSTGRTRPATRGRTAFAATTAKKGRKTAPAAKSQRIGWSMTTRSTKHAVRIDIVSEVVLQAPRLVLGAGLRRGGDRLR